VEGRILASEVAAVRALEHEQEALQRWRGFGDRRVQWKAWTASTGACSTSLSLANGAF
jgi:hypothetical protein